MIKVLNFRTYFYVRAPIFPDRKKIDYYLDSMKRDLNDRCENTNTIHKLELVQKESLMKYKGSNDAS